MSNIRAPRRFVSRGTFLIVDHDDASAGGLAYWARLARWEPVVTKSIELEQLARIADGCGGAIISLDTTDDCAWEFIRACQASLPLAVLGARDLGAAIQAQAIGVHYLYRPASFASVFGFADSIRPPTKVPVEPDGLAESGKRLGFTTRESEILVVFGSERPTHKDICASLSMTEGTLKTLAKRMLARARHRGIRASNLVELAARLRKNG